MTRAELLSRLSVTAISESGINVVSVHDKPRGLLWAALIEARTPDGPVVGHVVRRDPGDIGRTLLYFRAVPQDGRYACDLAMLGEVSIEAPLLVLCDLMLAVLDTIEAREPPDLEALFLLHLGVYWQAPSIRPYDGKGQIELYFE